MDDLYQYDKEYVGRKAYVSVRGHSKSIPKYKTYRGVDGYNYLLPEYGGDLSGMGNASAYLMPDKAEYMSPMSRTPVEGRAAHREHMKQHGVVEAGDIKFGGNRVDTPMSGTRQDIQRAIQELSSR